MHIKEPYSPDEFRSYFQARWEILRKPQGFDKGTEIDDYENISLHVMALDQEEIVGVGRLTYFSSGEGQVRFMGVREAHLNNGVGSAILGYLEDQAAQLHIDKIFLNARESAVEFYMRKGYHAEGKPYLGFADILHTRMFKRLP